MSLDIIIDLEGTVLPTNRDRRQYFLRSTLSQLNNMSINIIIDLEGAVLS